MEVLEAVPGKSVGAYRYSCAGGARQASGVLDARNGAVLTDMDVQNATLGPVKLQFLVVGDRSWIRVSFARPDMQQRLSMPVSWMLLDKSRIKNVEGSPMSYNGETDPCGTSSYIEAASGIVYTGEGRYSGTTDLNRVGASSVLDQNQLRALGDRARAVPFDAVMGRQGLLTSFVVRVSDAAAGAVNGGALTMTYSGYGSTPALTAPAATDQTEAPASVYNLLNG